MCHRTAAIAAASQVTRAMFLGTKYAGTTAAKGCVRYKDGVRVFAVPGYTVRYGEPADGRNNVPVNVLAEHAASDLRLSQRMGMHRRRTSLSATEAENEAPVGTASCSTCS